MMITQTTMTMPKTAPKTGTATTDLEFDDEAIVPPSDRVEGSVPRLWDVLPEMSEKLLVMDKVDTSLPAD